MDKEFYDKHSKDLECSCCQDLEHCINGKEPLRVNCAIHFFKDKIADLETKLAESDEYRELLLEEKAGYLDLISGYADKCKQLEQQLAEKEKEIKKIYPFVKKYHNGIFVEYNVVSERDGIISTTVFGKNKELAYKYKNSIKGESK